MTQVLAVAEPGGGAPVVEVGSALAEVLRADLRTLSATRGQLAAHRASEVLAELDTVDVVAAVLAAGPDEDAVCWRVVRRARKPVVLVPPDLGRPVAAVSRVLVPLDGTPASAEAVADLVALLAGAGVDIVVLHVFDATTAPMFWDQAAHTQQAWSAQFLSRHAPAGGRLELRSGTPGELVGSVAEAEQADLIALGWSQHLEPGRALTVRRSVLEAGRPVLLVPLKN
ncbi:universal stress protein [Jatrophihabitans cynanchi]|jgi:nucleotide-binding universal stress UspA family protein|uniref:Universal stress protein n=1 Tax=Jatrophihabitans cynanchi TaxID=2944128 RepID=A0ABY7JYM4_9ACTN|nr:universal stress protein [Jatrophihabitans sp. SB3-54]WAX57657.1 universal stress protein [Jatrophihabitans sp. SB3-54]